MVRRLAWLFVVALIVADVVLIATVLRTPGPSKAARASSAAGVAAAFPAPEMVAPTRSGRAPSAAGPAAPLGPAATNGPVAPAQPAPIASRTASPEASESGQITVLGESRDLDAPPSTSTSAPAGESSALEFGGALLAIGADGTILRAARGACPASAAAALAVSRDFGITWTPVSARMTQVLGVGASRAGAMWFVGTDTSCRPAAQESVDGLTWRQRGVAGAWYLNPDRDSTDVASPRLLSDVGCVPAALAGIDARRAVAACTDGDIRVTDDSGDNWTTRARMPATAALAFVSADRGYALAGTDGCPAAVLLTVDGGRTWTPLACLGDAVPLAIAAASARAATSGTSDTSSGAEMVVAQAGTELYVSRDGGRNWRIATAG